jgi:hypothetical protein
VCKSMARTRLKIMLEFSGLVFRVDRNIGYEFPRAEADRGGAETVVVGLEAASDVLGHADVGFGGTGSASNEIDEVHGDRVKDPMEKGKGVSRAISRISQGTSD